MLGQTNQIKNDCFFLRSTEKIKKVIYYLCTILKSKSKIRSKNPGHTFLDFILFFTIAAEKFGPKKRFF